MGVGAYFAYMQHPLDTPSDKLAQNMVKDAGVLCLPGTMFHPAEHIEAAQQLRIAFANIDAGGIEELYTRLATL